MDQQLTLPIYGMHCASCAITIQNRLRKSEGVITCDVNFGNEKAKIQFDPSKTTIEELNKKIEPLGYSFIVNEEKSNEHSHVMPDGSVISNHDMGGGDHSKHLGIGQTKKQKLKELNEQRKKVRFAMPLALTVFVLMLWEIANKSFNGFPEFLIPMEIYQMLSLIFATITLFWVGGEFLKEVVIFIRYKVANMYSLVGIGTLTAYIYSALIVLFPAIKEKFNFPETTYFDVVIVVIGFIFYGKYLETKSKLRTGEAIEKLLNLQAKTALVERDGKEMEIPIDQVKVSEIIIIKPGSKIPVDGVIIEGKSTVDESMITGESMPVDKKINDSVIGGTINKQGSFKFKATNVGSETLLAHIIKMVEEAQGSKAPIQGLADKISAVFVPVVLALAFITLLAWLIIGPQFLSFNEALSLGLLCFVGILVIACPCALGLATPTAIIVGTGKGAENGILIKNAESLEKLHKVNTIVTDKTGTITMGKPAITDVIAISNFQFSIYKQFLDSNDQNKERVILQLLASLENKSEHPLAIAILEKASKDNIDLLGVDDFEIIEGKGVKGKITNDELLITRNNTETFYAGNIKLIKDLNLSVDQKLINQFTEQGKTPVILATKNEVIAIIAIADTLKENAKETINGLHKLGLKVVMLTGDNETTAKFIADMAGIDEVIAEVLPNEKADKIKELQAKGDIVAMLGDGVNDAPALSQSDVGIAMGTGTDVAIESAEITILKGDISKVLKAIKLSKFTMKAIKQNLFWAFAYNIVGIPIAAGLLYPFFGILLNPIFAGAAMALSSVSVVANSLRLKTIKI